ncbi:amidohydrolase family protein, partial [Mycobacterium tuberculosis]|nr:amidohydrolase family protein [Mycobacterium tuberculosis]
VRQPEDGTQHFARVKVPDNVDQAVWAATAGGAHALDRSDVGHLGAGAQADLVVLDAPSYRHLAYRPGVHLVDRVFAGGELVADNRAQH